MKEKGAPDWDDWREAVIGLGDKSVRKSYYPQLQQRIDDLQAIQKSMRDLLNSMYDAVIIHDYEGKIYEVNNTFLEMYKLCREDLREATIEQISSWNMSKEKMREILERVRCGDQNILFEWEAHRPKDGIDFDVEVALRQVLWDGKALVVATIREITERKRVEKEKELMLQEIKRHKDDLARMFYVFGHDMRAPLVNLQGFSGELDLQVRQLLEHATAAGKSEPIKGLAENEIPHSIHYIRLSTQKLALHIDGMLRIGRAGQAVLQIQPLDCNAIVSTLLESIRWQIDIAGARVSVEDLPPCLGDRQWINQAFGNLLDNSLKYRSPERVLQIDIRGHREGNVCFYEFKDNGRGIQQEELPHIWDLFYRSTPRDGPDGEGLGLTMVRSIIERHGGLISVESSAGKGACFTVRLPSCVPHCG